MRISELFPENPIVKELEKYPKIAWDFDMTLVDGPASEACHKFIHDHPEIEHYILTARSSNELMSSMFPELAAYPTPLTRANFKEVLTSDHEKHVEFQRSRHDRQIGKLTGPLTPIEIYEFTIKGKRCHDLGIPVLVDDNIKRSEIGCKKYGIKIIDPINLL